MNREDLRLIAATVDADGDYREATARQSLPFIGCAAYPLKDLRNLKRRGVSSRIMGLEIGSIPVSGETWIGVWQGSRLNPCRLTFGETATRQ
jgi:hypothetical protein